MSVLQQYVLHSYKTAKNHFSDVILKLNHAHLHDVALAATFCSNSSALWSDTCSKAL